MTRDGLYIVAPNGLRWSIVWGLLWVGLAIIVSVGMIALLSSGEQAEGLQLWNSALLIAFAVFNVFSPDVTTLRDHAEHLNAVQVFNGINVVLAAGLLFTATNPINAILWGIVLALNVLNFWLNPKVYGRDAAAAKERLRHPAE